MPLLTFVANRVIKCDSLESSITRMIMLIVKFLDPSIVQNVSIVLANVMTGRNLATFEGSDPAGPASLVKIRSSSMANSSVIAVFGGILWNDDLVPIMNRLIPSLPLPYLELVGNIKSQVSLLLENP